MNPCGLGMDWLRSCYSVPVLFREGDEPIVVQWYFCEENANAFPYFHSFPSLNWLGNGWHGADIGERANPRPWKNGTEVFGSGVGNQFAIECARLLPVTWRDGLTDGQETGPYAPNGLPECCVDGPPPPPDPCESSWSCGDLPDILVATVVSATGTFFCGDPTGTSFNMVRSESDPCLWEASVTFGGLFGNFFFSSGDPGGGITVECPDLSGKAFALEAQYIGLVREGPLSCSCDPRSFSFSLTMAGVSNLCLFDGAVLNIVIE